MTTVARYRLDAPIGVGPDGPVHRALPERLGARPVAIRTADVAAGPARAELRHRAELVARLGHPGVAAVLDIVELDDQRVDVASELGGDGNLADRLLIGSLSAADVVTVARTLADALRAAAHLGLHLGHLSAVNVVFGDRGAMVTDLAMLPPAGTGHDDDRQAFGTLITAMAERVPAGTSRDELAAFGRRLEADGRLPWPAVVDQLDRVTTRIADDPGSGSPRRSDGDAADMHRPSVGAASARSAPVGPAVVASVVAGAAALGVLIGAATTALPL